PPGAHKQIPHGAERMSGCWCFSTRWRVPIGSWRSLLLMRIAQVAPLGEAIARMQTDYGINITGTVTPDVLNALGIVAQQAARQTRTNACSSDARPALEDRRVAELIETIMCRACDLGA